MSTTARRRITITYSGDVDGEEVYDASDNASSPAFIQPYRLTAGVALSFSVPKEANGFGEFTPTAVTILKPGDYEGTIILKGDSAAADAEGIYLHPTDPDTISIDADNQSTIVLKASAECDVRLIWT